MNTAKRTVHKNNMDRNRHQICTSNRKLFYKVAEIQHRKKVGQQLFGSLHTHDVCLTDFLVSQTAL